MVEETKKIRQETKQVKYFLGLFNSCDYKFAPLFFLLFLEKIAKNSFARGYIIRCCGSQSCTPTKLKSLSKSNSTTPAVLIYY